MDVLHFPPGIQRGLSDQLFLQKFEEKGTSCGESQDYNGNYRSNSLIARGTDMKKAETAIQQLRIAMNDCNLNSYSDDHLIRFLSMQDFNLIRTEKMLRQSLEWRRLNRADELLDTYTPKEVFQKYYSFSQFGIDKYGCPVGNVDVKGLAVSSTKKEFYDFLIWMEETSERAAKETSERIGKQVTTSTLILDFENLSMRKMTCKIVVQQLLETAKLKAFYYPMNCRRAFIINAPKTSFQIVLALLKPFVPECAFATLKVFGSDRNEWAAALLEEIEADQFPAYYGGTLTDPDGDPKCPSMFNMGGEVPQSYYLCNNGPVAKDYMESMVIIAGASGKKKLKYKVDIPFSVLRWEFMTEGGDIRFRVYTKDSKGNTEDLVPLSRVDSHLVMEEGQIICDEPGKYIFEFDNTFSYLRTKKLRYHIFVEQP